MYIVQLCRYNNTLLLWCLIWWEKDDDGAALPRKKIKTTDCHRAKRKILYYPVNSRAHLENVI